MSVRADPAILIYSCCVAAVLGAVLGSFLNCAAYRIAHGESFLRGRGATSAAIGGMTMDQALVKLVRTGVITKDVALHYSHSRDYVNKNAM